MFKDSNPRRVHGKERRDEAISPFPVASVQRHGIEGNYPGNSIRFLRADLAPQLTLKMTGSQRIGARTTATITKTEIKIVRRFAVSHGVFACLSGTKPAIHKNKTQTDMIRLKIIPSPQELKQQPRKNLSHTTVSIALEFSLSKNSKVRGATSALVRDGRCRK